MTEDKIQPKTSHQHDVSPLALEAVTFMLDNHSLENQERSLIGIGQDNYLRNGWPCPPCN